ncbi:MAG: ferrous iron transport protein B [Clostridia bacterium]|nr:ferrous iron transport protein B [Clostridia bacterium]
MSEKLMLVGNPNVGKTTLFNCLSNSFEHTGNWHGVTVDKKEKQIECLGKKFDLVDLPGLYSLSSFSFEEQVSIDYIQKNSGIVIDVVDGNVLQRNLYLTLGLLEMNISPVIFVNFAKEIKEKGTIYDYKKLSQILGVCVISIDKKIEKNLLEKLTKKFENFSTPLPYLCKLPLDEIKEILTKEQMQIFYGKENFLCIKILEQDESVFEKINLTEIQKKRVNRIIEKEDFLSKIASLRFEYISQIMKEITVKKGESVYGKHKIDKIILNKFLCFPIFLLILFGIFFITFSSVGSFLSQGLKELFDLVAIPTKQFLISINSPIWVVGLFSTAIISGVGGLLSFIPQIVLLFLFLSLLEDSGYMSRLAFSFEEIFYKFGLSGKSIFTILMSLGCSTTAVMTARNIEDKNTKLKTAMLTPYMSCSAKLPIYAVIGGSFFGKGNILVIISMYVLGLIVALIVSNILNRGKLRSGERSFILEFPQYRLPNFRRVFSVIWQNCKTFVVKVSTILLSFSVIVWILQNFSFSFIYVPTSTYAVSMLETVGKWLCFIFVPIGLGNYGIVVSLLVGVMAKEMVVATMAIINKVPNSNNFDEQLGSSFLSSGFVITFSPVTAIVMMVFSLLYLPCVSTMAVLRQEIGLKWTLFACTLQFSIAYGICFLIYNFATGSAVFKFLIGFLVLLGTFLLLIFSKKTCEKCSTCNFNCKKCFLLNN